MKTVEEQRWYKRGFDEACWAGNEPRPPIGRKAGEVKAYERGFADRRALEVRT